MAGYQGHLAGGLILGGGLMALAVWLGFFPEDYPALAGLMGFCLAGALFPDIDTKSKGQYLFYAALLALDVGLLWRRQYQWAAWLGLVAIIPGVTPHRGWTHSVWAMFLVPLPLLAIPAWLYGEPHLDYLPYYLACVAGYFSHLLLDGMFFPRR